MSLNLVHLKVRPGLIKDETAFKTRQGGYRAINNMRPRRDELEVVGGYEFLTTDTLTGMCRGQFAWRDNDGELNIAFGTHSKLYVYVGGGLYDITPSSGFTAGNADGFGGSGFGTGAYGASTYGSGSGIDAFPLTWSFKNYGETLIANPRGQGVFQWSNDTGVVAAAVANAPTEVNFIDVTPSRQIVAYGCNEETSGTYNQRCIRWCDIEDITDWTTSATNNAGEQILRDAGRLIAATSVGADSFVWTDEGLFAQQYIGDPGQTFRFYRLGTNCGLVGPNAFAVLGQQAFWAGPDFKFRTAGVGGAPQVIPAPVEREFETSQAQSQQEKIYACALGEFGEVWWFYPHVDDGAENSRYLAFSATEGEWFAGDWARTAMIDASPYQYPLAVDPDGKIYIHERGVTANGDQLPWEAETGDIALSESGRVMMLRSLRPDLHDQKGAVNLTVKTKAYPQGDEITHGPYACDVSADKVDFRASGAIVRLKWEGAGVSASCRLGRPVFDATTRGRR